MNESPKCGYAGCKCPAVLLLHKLWGKGGNRESPSPERGAIRSVTYRGIAEAMAEQWGRPVEVQGSLFGI